MISLIAAVLAGALAEHFDAASPGARRSVAYMRNRSPAKIAASSPPVPARISRKMFASSRGSRGISSFVSSTSSASMRARSAATSSAASLRSSGSPARRPSRARPRARLRDGETREARADRLEPRVFHRQLAEACGLAARPPGPRAEAPTSSKRSAVFSSRRRIESFMRRGRDRAGRCRRSPRARRHRRARPHRADRWLGGCIRRLVSVSARNSITALRVPTARQHAFGLLDRLLADRLGVVAQTADRGRGIARAQTRARSGRPPSRSAGRRRVRRRGVPRDCDRRHPAGRRS